MTPKTITKSRQGKKVVVGFLIILLVLSMTPAGLTQAEPTDGDVTILSAAWTTGGPAGGHANSLTVATSNPDTVYAGTVSGVYKSSDGGAHWAFAGLAGVDVKTIQVKPTDANTVYAGATTQDGFFKSTNGGTSWTQGSISGILALTIDPLNPNNLWAGTITGRIYKSSNAGDTWTQKLHKTRGSWDTPVNSICIDPADSSVIYAGLGGSLSPDNGYEGFGKSTDGGTTWSYVHISPYDPWDFGENLIVTPTGRLFIIAEGSMLIGMEPTVYSSVNQGETWTELVVPNIGEVASRYYRVNFLYANPADSNKIFVGTTNPDFRLMMYTISTESWTNAGGELPTAVSCVAVNPLDASDAYMGARDGRIYYSSNQGATWSVSNQGLNNTLIHDLAISPSTSSAIFAAVTGESFGLQKSIDGGGSWSETNAGTAGFFTAIEYDPSNANRMFAGKQDRNGIGTIYRSLNGGSSWSPLDGVSSSGRVTDFWTHPSDPNIVLALKRQRVDYHGTTWYGGVRRTTDGGTNWAQIMNAWKPTCLAASPANPNTVYMGAEELGFVFRSTNSGQSWNDITPSSVYQWWNVNDMVVDDNDTVYAATTDYDGNTHGGIWRYSSTAWVQLYRFPSSNVTALAIDRTTSPATLYAGTDNAGVFISQNGGTSWDSFNTGLGFLNIKRLEISSTQPRKLYAGMNHGGVWATPVASGTSLDNPANLQAVAASSSQINLSWTKNAANNNVMLVSSSTNTFGTPQNGTSYSSGATVPGGGTVLYRGSNTVYNHTGLGANTIRYYKAFSYTASYDYSSGTSAHATTLMDAINAFPWTETFEDNSPTRVGWTQVYVAGTHPWTFSTGSSGGIITTAHEGSKNARFTSSAGGPYITKLVTPVLDISALGNPTVSFWYGQEIWDSDQNELKVYYRTGPTGSWIQIFHDNSNRSNWVQATVQLPETSATFQLAFEGIDAWGFANVLDQVMVEGEVIVDRIYGANRYSTAVKVSQEGWPDGADTVLLARGDNFPDSLAGVSLAYQLDAPILLTSTASLSTVTRTEIERLGASRIIILGGTGAVSEAVASTLLTLDSVDRVDRLAGSNRYDTARFIAEELSQIITSNTAFLASGLDFPDALAAASYGAMDGNPIFLTRKDSLPTGTLAALDNLTGIQHITLVGGTAVISTAVENELKGRGLNVIRIAGSNRYATAVELARTYLPLDAARVFIATGLNFPDALAGGVLAAKWNTGVMLVRGDQTTLNASVEAFIVERNINQAVILGGTSAVSVGIEQSLGQLLQ